MRYLFVPLVLSVSALALVACSANSDSNGFDEDGGGGETSGSGGNGASSSSGLGFGGNMSTGSGSTCDSGPDDDFDADGFTSNQGDCNDCDPMSNPNAVEVIAGPDENGMTPEPADEDCDGDLDEIEVCDTGIAVDDMDPMSAAHAVELCQTAGATGWGVVSAQWVMVDGSPENGSPNFHLGHGILNGFGTNVSVQGGERMLALSSGTARQPTDVGYAAVSGFDKGYTGGHPMGFPKESPACPGSITGILHDGTAVEVVVRVPSNAKGFSFDFNFYTYEWPGWVCSTYNDFFVALLSPIPMGQTDGNISFDSQGNPVSVNNAFVDVCGCMTGPPCLAGGKTFTCSLGAGELLGTGFGIDTDGYSDHGATSWLKTTAPADPGTEITIRWGVYDSGDGVLDSTTLIDNWQWTADPGEVGTTPVPDPK